MQSAVRLLLVVAIVFICSETLLAQTLAPSWRDRGMQMLGEGRLDSARFYLEKWLEADPRDDGSWYNLACVYALQGERERSLDAWERSVEAGWDDPEHPLNDADLESIRSNERFTAALKKVGERNAAKGPTGFVRHVLETRSVGTYIVALPDDYETSGRAYPLCVILHGSGSTELAHGRLADVFGREDVIYIAPRAPYGHTSSFKGSGELGYTAWTPEDIDSLDPLYDQVPLMYADWIVRCIDDARVRYRVQGEKTIVLGHSQGAAFAYITAALYPEQIGSVFAYAGYFPDAFRTDERLRGLKDENVRLTIGHGSADNVVDPAESSGIAELLKEWNIEYALLTYEGVGHGIAPEVREHMKEWIDTETGRAMEGDVLRSEPVRHGDGETRR